MKIELHKSETRGRVDLGWLQSYHSFSFSSYFNPERMGFGSLRVINDDVIAPAKGFDTHPHRDMEIITILLSGALKHKDSMGNDFVIKKGEIQAMSAGTGIAHSEHNDSSIEDVSLLQIWVLPKKLGVKPSYSQKSFKQGLRENQFQLIVSPDGRNNSVEINQDAFFSLVKLSKGHSLTYDKYLKENGIYFFAIEGSVEIEGVTIHKRDGLGLEQGDQVSLVATEDTELLVMEVPMLINS